MYAAPVPPFVCAPMPQPVFFHPGYGQSQLFVPVFAPQPVVFVPVAPAPLPVYTGCSNSAPSSSSSSRSSSPPPIPTKSKSSRKWERDMDLDAMTRRNGGTLTHSDYQDQMNELCQMNHKSGCFAYDKDLLQLNFIRNHFLDDDAVELHGLPRKLAVDVLKKTVNEVYNGLRPKKLYLCVGQGNNSATGESVIKREVMDKAAMFGYSCRPMKGNRGVLVLEFP